ITIRDNTAPTFTRPADVTIYTSATCTYDKTVTATGDVSNEADNCSTGLQASFTDVTAAGTCEGSKVITRTWHLVDNCTNAAADQIQTITINDNIAPVITCPAGSSFTKNTDLNLCTYKIQGTEFNATATDNCSTTVMTWSVTGATTLSGSGSMANVVLNKGANTINWTATDACNNTSTCSIVVNVNDAQLPSITCPANITLSACVGTASWTTALATDNCPGVIVAQTAGPVSGSTFAAGTTTTISYEAKDTGGNVSSCSFTVTRATALSATFTRTNPNHYFGLSGDQTSKVTVTPSGGVGPYTVSITMSRPLICNYMNSTGDESWIAGTIAPPCTTTSSNITFPSTGLNPGGNPITVATGISVNGSYSVTVGLMANASFTATITDANGCIITALPFDIHGEDVRCFAGNSGKLKVKICHKTGNGSCKELCVDESAVGAHLAHGDFLGSCASGCVAPTLLTKFVKNDKKLIEPTPFNVKAYPNPTQHQFTLVVKGGSNEKVEVIVYDMLARMVKRFEKSDGQLIMFGEELPTGEYLTVIKQGVNIKTVNLIKQ
ncbi:HYR domain-containing protein, partial [Flavobacterium sp. ZB4R12]|uniref:HYR domain-containing protein n=1 Tax=Flavobacterium sp. ZB4R12 TaxID=3398732 RepID=UPI003AAEF45E